MTLKVLKSQVHEDFAAQVDAYVAELKAWVSTVDVPRPTANALVEGAVARIRSDGPDDFAADFEIEDDTPVLTDDDKKTAAIRAVRKKEQDAIAALLPEGKRRFIEMAGQLALSKPPANRTPDEQKAATEYKDFSDASFAVSFAAAKAEYDIEDAKDHEERIAIVEREFAK